MTFYTNIKNHKNLTVETWEKGSELDFYKLPNYAQEATTENAVISITKGGLSAFTWHSGIWVQGIFRHGIWKNGTWLNGEWSNGIWNNGIWHNGGWWEGLWHDGVWLDGYWFGGTWQKGVFVKGWHHNNQPLYGFDSLGNMIL
jgi:hypothetical protein